MALSQDLEGLLQKSRLCDAKNASENTAYRLNDDLLVLEHVNDSFSSLRHCVQMLLVSLVADVNDTTVELVLVCLLLHLLQPSFTVLSHKVVVLQIKVVFNHLFDLLGVELFPVVVLLDMFLLRIEDILRSWLVFFGFPVALRDLDIFPLGGDSSGHFMF